MTTNTSTSQNQPGASFNLTETLSNCAEHSKPIIYYKTGDAKKSLYCYECLASEYSLSSALKVPHSLPQNFIATPFFRKKYLNELQEIDSLIEKHDITAALSEKVNSFSDKVSKFFGFQIKKALNDLVINDYKKTLESFIDTSKESSDLTNAIKFVGSAEQAKFDIKTSELKALNHLHYLQNKFISCISDIKKNFNDMLYTFFKLEEKECDDKANKIASFTEELKEIANSIIPLSATMQTEKPKEKEIEQVVSPKKELVTSENIILSISYSKQSLCLSSESADKKEKQFQLKKPKISSFEDKENIPTNYKTSKRYNNYKTFNNFSKEEDRKKINELISTNYQKRQTLQGGFKSNISSFVSQMKSEEELKNVKCNVCNNTFRISKSSSSENWRCINCFRQHLKPNIQPNPKAIDKKINAVCTKCGSIYSVLLADSRKKKLCANCEKSIVEQAREDLSKSEQINIEEFFK